VHNGPVPKGILFDLDGVLYDGEGLIAGAAEAVAWARREKIPHLFVTNTTSRPRAAIAGKLSGFGIEAAVDDVLTPAVATVRWLSSQPPGGVALFAAPALRPEFEGLDLVDDGARYVIVGDLGEAWDFATLNRAFRMLMASEEVRLLALGMTRYWQTPSGLSLDVAPFVVALEHASGRKAVVLGKPAREFFLAAVSKLGLPPGDVLMVGDDIRADVGGARGAGLRGALVRTGKFREADLDGEVQPDLVLASVAELPFRWKTAAW
jgi:phospholysine phosphohistidine inorganic pyrophosphate phosphatase